MNGMHIYEQQRENININAKIIIEDNQKDMEVEYCGNPTLLAYTTNKTSFTVYLICTDFLGDDHHLKKGQLHSLLTTNHMIINK